MYILEKLMTFCYNILNNYGMAILFFTIITKIILFPLSIILQKNSIKMIKMYPELNNLKIDYYGNQEMISTKQLELYKKYKYNPFLDLIPLIIQIVLLMGIVKVIGNQINLIPKDNLLFLGVYLNKIPIKSLGNTLLIPIIAALSAFLMCVAQNKSNVLQSEQSNLNKYTTTILSVLLSLYLGLFVTAGVGLYWIFSNLLAIIQLYILNFLINPKKFIDYEALNESKERLKLLKKEENKVDKKELKKKEKEDYKRFCKYRNMQIVFYSEKNGFYKYYKDVIEYILKNSDIIIHYITNDYNDEIFNLTSDRFQTYYIGVNKSIPLFMKMDCNVVVMTTPDLEKFYLKRSYVNKNTKYVFLPHSVNSDNMAYLEGALNHFDSVFAVGPNYRKEQESINKYFNLKREIVDFGSCFINDLKKSYKEIDNETKQILIAPSWQEDNLMNYIDILFQNIDKSYDVILRPHPYYIKHNPGILNELKEKYSNYKNIIIDDDFSKNTYIDSADLLITDWSSIAYEYAFASFRPVISINTKPKILNPNYKKINVPPIDLEIRDKIGKELKINEIKDINNYINEIINNKEFYKKQIKNIIPEYLYDTSQSDKLAGEYLIKLNNIIQEKEI